MNLIDDIKKIISLYIKTKYKEYISSKKILFIKEEILDNVILTMYDNNIKQIRQNIRSELKIKYPDNYPSAIVENIILDITQDKEYSIGIITNNVLHLQNMNFKSINVPIFNDSLNININIIDNVVVINNIKKDAIEDYDKYSDIYEIIEKYKYIYSINNKILTDYDDSEKITIIKNCINGSGGSVELGLYKLKSHENNGEGEAVNNN